MNIFDLGFTKTYRAIERKVVNEYHRRKNAAIVRHCEKAAAERRNAAINLLLDDAKFHGIDPTSLLGPEHDDAGYRSAIGEDFPDDY